MKKIFFLGLLVMCSYLTFAQKAPMKLGKVDIEDLQMSVYQADSSANAVMLCEYGEFNDQQILFTHLMRLKIITKEGLSSMIFKIPGNTKNDVKGFVMNLDEEGKIVKEKISKDHIFLQKSDGETNVRVAPPNVKEGSIVDIQYTYNGFPSLWRFQRTIPVRYNEFYMPDNADFSFRLTQIGYEYIRSIGRQHFVATDMPAFHAEKLLNSENNYISGVLIDLTSYWKYTSSGYRIIQANCESWDDVNEYYFEHKSFGKRLDEPTLYLNSVASDIQAETVDPMEQVNLALKIIHDNIQWDETVDMFPEINLKEVWTGGSGTAADMNFLFMRLLNKLDIESAPVIISNRYTGRVNPYFPTVTKFNAFIPCVFLGEKKLFIDASDKYCYPGTLPGWALSEGGFMIQKEKGTWMKIAPELPDSKMNSAQLVLDDEGNFSGKVYIRYSDYASIDFREDFDFYSSTDEYLEDFESDNENVFVVDYSNNIEEADFGPVTETMEVEMEGYATSMGDMITFNPIFFERWEQNPLKLEDREYPVDFMTPIKEMLIFNVSFPEGYALEQLPASVRVKTESGSIVFQYNAVQQNNNIQFMVKLDIKKPIFIQSEYGELKELLNIIVRKEAEQVILKKI